jgi:hypothetical protein
VVFQKAFSQAKLWFSLGEIQSLPSPPSSSAKGGSNTSYARQAQDFIDTLPQSVTKQYHESETKH